MSSANPSQSPVVGAFSRFWAPCGVPPWAPAPSQSPVVGAFSRLQDADALEYYGHRMVAIPCSRGLQSVPYH